MMRLLNILTAETVVMAVRLNMVIVENKVRKVKNLISIRKCRTYAVKCDFRMLKNKEHFFFFGGGVWNRTESTITEPLLTCCTRPG
jgi:hypothetical protein